ncbi:hypothetical protein [Mumia sp.]|uniref:hypothetical protein n=1 Tax=Mumia sp. TaxID=1965300 RepID=UPI0026206ACF|nr:hypothetical protein [Mumia sp.]MDD9350027.1 hypothetical protein [Mumia sp.]
MVLFLALLPIRSLRPYDDALVLLAATILMGSSVVVSASRSSRSGRRTWEVWLGRVAITLVGSGLALKALSFYSAPPRTRFAFLTAGIVVFTIGLLLEDTLTGEARVKERQRDRDYLEYEAHRRQTSASG